MSLESYVATTNIVGVWSVFTLFLSLGHWEGL